MLRVLLGVPCPDLCDACRLARATAPKALTTQMAEVDLGPVEPTAVFGGLMARSCIGYAFRRSGLKGFIQRCFGMGIQIVQHQTTLLHVRILLINKFLDKVRPLHCGPLFRNCGIPLTSSWVKSENKVCRPMALIRCVISQWLARLSWERSPDFANQLGRQFIETSWGTLSVLRWFIDS